jgi:phosphotransferase system enzyme I (PtsP)
MASKPLSAMALLGIGFRSISMSPTAIGPVKAMLLGLDIGQLSEVLMAALDDDTPGVSVRDLLLRHAEEHNIPV